MDFSLYWFMLPLAVLVSTTAMLAGIGGTALFMPIFLLLFPLLGDHYTIQDPVTAIAAALLTSSFGFLSGFIGYYRKGLIDFNQSYSFAWFSVPFALLGVFVAHSVNPLLLRTAYGVLLFMLSYIMIMGFPLVTAQPSQTITQQRGSYRYTRFKPLKVLTSLGGMLTGMLSTGIGEVIMPQLVKAGKIPVPVAAATSVLAVMLTMMVASGAHVVTLIKADGFNAIPWHLVCYTIPGVLIGGQLGPALQGRIKPKTMTLCIGILFIFLGLSMLWTTWG